MFATILFVWLASFAYFFLVGVAEVAGLRKDEDYYTSMVGIQRLARQEQDIIASVLNYKTLLMERLALIDNYLQEYETSLRPEKESPLRRIISRSKARSWSKSRPWLAHTPKFGGEKELQALEEYTSSNPMAAYKILRRLSKELPELVNHFGTEIETDFVTLIDQLSEEIRIPNQEDLDGAANGLLRIQSTFSIPIDKFTAGDFGEPGPKLTSAFDLRHIGLLALTTGHFSVAVQYLEKALHAVTHQEDCSASYSDILEDLEIAVNKHNEGLLSTGLDEVMSHMYFPHALESNISILTVPRKLGDSIPPHRQSQLETGLEQDTWMDVWNFLALCGGRNLLDENIRSQLTCYFKKDSPLTFLSPVGVEEHSKSPPILQFYGILRNGTIDQIQRGAGPHLLRSRVLGTPENRDQKSDIRTSAVTWVRESGDHHHVPGLKTLPNLIKDLTGLNAEAGFCAEDLQISSYGAIGGHYQQHFDTLYDDAHFASETQTPSEKLRGDRIATIMFYLSDVRLGGGTAFPRVGVVVTPVKGSAIFWYNLKRNGDKDKLSLHGGCPVGQGIKWVANKWIRSTGQLTNRPCDLDPAA